MTNEIQIDFNIMKHSLNEYQKNSGKSPVFLTLSSGEWVISNKICSVHSNHHGIIERFQFDEWKEKRKEFGNYCITHESNVSWKSIEMSNKNKREELSLLSLRVLTGCS